MSQALLHAEHIGNVNPIRYKGYYYDAETGFYYVSSRYYDFELGRFINADTTSVLGIRRDLYNQNLYAYCDNNPIVRIDITGGFWEAILFGFAMGYVGQYVSDVIYNYSSGIRGAEMFVPMSSMNDYFGAGIGGAIAAIPGYNLGGTMSVGAAGSLATNLIKGNIDDIEDVKNSAFIGAIANAFGYLASKVMAASKVKQIQSMPRSQQKNYLRDVMFHSQADVNVNLRKF